MKASRITVQPPARREPSWSRPGQAAPSWRPMRSGTFTMTLRADPGNLDPQSSPTSALFQASKFAYDSLLSMDPADGSIQSAAGHRLDRRRDHGAAHPRRGHHLLRRLAADRERCRGQPGLRGRPGQPEPLPGHLLPGRRHGRGGRRGAHRHHHARRARSVRAQRAVRPAHRVRRGHGRSRVQARQHDRRHRALRAERGGPRRPLHVHHPRRLHLGTRTAPPPPPRACPPRSCCASWRTPPRPPTCC